MKLIRETCGGWIQKGLERGSGMHMIKIDNMYETLKERIKIFKNTIHITQTEILRNLLVIW